MRAANRVDVLGRDWDITPDSNRFIVVTQPTETASAPITVVLNWEAALRK